MVEGRGIVARLLGEAGVARLGVGFEGRVVAEVADTATVEVAGGTAGGSVVARAAGDCTTVARRRKAETAWKRVEEDAGREFESEDMVALAEWPRSRSSILAPPFWCLLGGIWRLQVRG